MEKNEKKTISSVKKIIGIGSYSYRYNIGTSDFSPSEKLTVIGFIEEAKKLGLHRILICENLNYKNLPVEEWTRIKSKLNEYDMIAEIGLRDMEYDNIKFHISIAEYIGSDFLRIVSGKPSSYPEESPDKMSEDMFNTLSRLLPELNSKSIRIGIENHFDLPTQCLVNIVERLDDKHIGMILDTTNALGFVESIDETASMILPHLMSTHIKDYKVTKVDGGYLVSGTILGEGLLNYENILRRVINRNSNASIILELSLLKDPDLSIESTLQWEKEQIAKSISILKNAVIKITGEKTNVQTISN